MKQKIEEGIKEGEELLENDQKAWLPGNQIPADIQSRIASGDIEETLRT